MNKFLVLLLVISWSQSHSQTDYEKRYTLTQFDPTQHEKIYRIQVADYQILELIKFKNETTKGTLTHFVWSVNKKEIRKDSIIQKITVPDLISGELLRELKNGNIELIKDCDEIENCIRGLDGTTTIFDIITETGLKSASYWELESDYYYNQNKTEIPKEVIQARQLTAIVNHHFDMTEQFQNFLDRLPRGRYAYSSIIMQVIK